MGKFSRDKGKRGERRLVNRLKGEGWITSYRSQQRKGAPDSPDVIAPDCPVPTWEVKDCERLSIRPALEKQIAEYGSDETAVVWYKNYCRTIVTVDLDVFLGLLKEVDQWRFSKMTGGSGTRGKIPESTQRPVAGRVNQSSD